MSKGTRTGRKRRVKYSWLAQFTGCQATFGYVPGRKCEHMQHRGVSLCLHPLVQVRNFASFDPYLSSIIQLSIAQLPSFGSDLWLVRRIENVNCLFSRAPGALVSGRASPCCEYYEPVEHKVPLTQIHRHVQPGIHSPRRSPARATSHA